MPAVFTSLFSPTSTSPVLCRVRRGRGILLVLTAVLGPASPALAERPAFVGTYQEDIQPIRVLAVESLSLADIVVLEGGYQHGYRPGMLGQVIRAGRPVGDILIIDVRPTRAAATIQSLPQGMSIQPGDVVRPRIVSPF